MTDWWTMGVIAGLSCVTVVARSFFFISSKPWSLPHWAQRGLQYGGLGRPLISLTFLFAL
jgi:branched-subunit amino acid transport protein